MPRGKVIKRSLDEQINMLEEDIPITTIQGVLGHLNIETTERYTGIDVSQLKKCALEVPGL